VTCHGTEAWKPAKHPPPPAEDASASSVTSPTEARDAGTPSAPRPSSHAPPVRTATPKTAPSSRPSTPPPDVTSRASSRRH
jgi:hypothetical protein